MLDEMIANVGAMVLYWGAVVHSSEAFQECGHRW
jgi:hypothetical protein